MIQNRQIPKRVLLAFIFSGLIMMPLWFVMDERPPFYWYFLYRPFLKNLWWELHILPYFTAGMASGNFDVPSIRVFIVAGFAQWFILLFFLSRLILKVSLKFVLIFIITGSFLIGVAGWWVSGPQRLYKSAQTTRFKELKLGLGKEEALHYFGPPNLECSKESGTYFPGPYNEQINRLTANRWVYFHEGLNTVYEDEDRSKCLPGKWDTEIGFGHDGKILWFNRIVGTTGPEIDTTKLNNN